MVKTKFEPQTGATLTQLKRELTSSKLQKTESKHWNKNYKLTEKKENGNRKSQNPNIMWENIVCWKCNQKGHVQMNCPQNKGEESGMMASQSEEIETSQTEVSFVAINETKQKSDLWIRDTGASIHMKNTIDGLFDLRKKDHC